MMCLSWNGPGGYDCFIRVDEKEMQVITDHYGDPEAAGWGWEGDIYHFYLVCDEKRILTPLKMPSLAFGGQWMEPPYGKEAACHFSLETLPEYRLEPDWRAPK